MKKLLLGLLVLGFFATNVQADYDHRDGEPLLTTTVAWGVTHAIAGAVCQSLSEARSREGLSLRLPTARELAQYAQFYGALGISKTMKSGFKLIKGVDKAGRPDSFYYSNKGYRLPREAGGGFHRRSTSDSAGKTMWSNSVLADMAYGFKWDTGDMGLTHLENGHKLMAVLCMKDIVDPRRQRPGYDTWRFDRD